MVVSLVLLCLMGPAASPAQTATHPFSWSDSGVKWEAALRVGISPYKEIVATASLRSDGRLRWESSTGTLTDREAPPYMIDSLPEFVAQSTARAFPAAVGQRLMVLDVPAPNWTYSVFWLCHPVQTEPLILSRRAEFEEVVEFHRTGGKVDKVTLYDRWVGGPQPEATQRGVRLSRSEEVSEYALAASGFKRVRTRRRIVPNGGGGIHETNYVWVKKA